MSNLRPSHLGEHLMRPTHDEYTPSHAGKGCPEYHRKAAAVTDRHPVVKPTCVQAYCLNDHAKGDMEYIEFSKGERRKIVSVDSPTSITLGPPVTLESPVAVYGGGYAQLSTWARNTLLLAAVSVCLALVLGVGYLLASGWPHFVAGLRNLSSW